MSEQPVLDRIFVLELVRVTEATAVAASRLIGRGNEQEADAAAVNAMRNALNKIEMEGVVVIGEGERDEAPMLYIGEKVGTGSGTAIDIALDPLEGTTITAKAMSNALAVIALAERGNLLNAPDVYMDKIAVGAGYAPGIVDLDRAPADNIRAVAKAKGVPPEEIMVCILDRPRHSDLIRQVREVGARIMLIGDGDVAGVINTTAPESDVDIYMGSGGAPEGVLAAAALRCIGGQIQSRLLFRNEDEKKRAYGWGITDLDRKYETEDMAKGDVIFSATGVTHGAMLDGVRTLPDGRVSTHTVVMRSRTRTVRYVKAEHYLRS